jgi:hypothetical protein
MRIRLLVATGVTLLSGLFGAVTAVTPAHAATQFTTIINSNSNLVLAADSRNVGAMVRQQQRGGAQPYLQEWYAENIDGYIRFRTRRSIVVNGRYAPGCLALPRTVPADQQWAGEVLVVRECDGGYSQQWRKTFDTASDVRLTNRRSAMWIDIDNNRPLQPNAVAIQNDVFEFSQRFRFGVVSS